MAEQASKEAFFTWEDVGKLYSKFYACSTQMQIKTKNAVIQLLQTCEISNLVEGDVEIFYARAGVGVGHPIGFLELQGPSIVSFNRV
jgi:hypothetical protein